MSIPQKRGVCEQADDAIRATSVLHIRILVTESRSDALTQSNNGPPTRTPNVRSANPYPRPTYGYTFLSGKYPNTRTAKGMTGTRTRRSDALHIEMKNMTDTAHMQTAHRI